MFVSLSGDKSEVLDVDDPDLTKYPKFAKTTRYECELEPGDILFIPGKGAFTLNERESKHEKFL